MIQDFWGEHEVPVQNTDEIIVIIDLIVEPVATFETIGLFQITYKNFSNSVDYSSYIVIYYYVLILQ